MANMKATNNKNGGNIVDYSDWDFRSLCHGCGRFICRYEGACLCEDCLSVEWSCKRRCWSGISFAIRIRSQSLHATSLPEPWTVGGLGVVWLELSLQVGQILDQVLKGDSPLVVVLPALPHQLIHLPDINPISLFILGNRWLTKCCNTSYLQVPQTLTSAGINCCCYYFPTGVIGCTSKSVQWGVLHLIMFRFKVRCTDPTFYLLTLWPEWM